MRSLLGSLLHLSAGHVQYLRLRILTYTCVPSVTYRKRRGKEGRTEVSVGLLEVLE